MNTFLKSLRVAVAGITLATATAQLPDTLKYFVSGSSVGGQAGGRFGTSVAIDGVLMVVGAPYEDAGATDSGDVKVFDTQSGQLLFVLSNPSPGSWEQFGVSVAISGMRVVVGTPGNYVGISSNAGSAYVYDLGGTSPTEPVATLTNPSPFESDFFGYSVAISGQRVVVGALWDNTGATDAGSAYVYDLTSASPSVPLVLNNPSPNVGDEFGVSVAISGARVVVGAIRDDTGAMDAGCVYLYDLASGTPTAPLVLNNPDPNEGDFFGNSVAVSGSRVVVGALADHVGTTSVGSAFVYDLASATPTVPLAIHNPSPNADDTFGYSVAISNTHVLIGARFDDSGATDTGSAYLYDVASAAPTVPLAVLNNPSPDLDDRFGLSVGISGSYAVIGVPRDDIYDIDVGNAYVFGPNTTTLTPTLTTPVANAFINNTVNVAFSLPEAALPGSVTLSFGGTVLTLADSEGSAGAHAFTFDPANPTASPQVASGAPILDGVYAVRLSYQDALGNAVASAAVANVTVDTVPPTLSGVFSPLVVNFGDPVADYTGQAVSDTESVVQFPHAGTWLQLGPQSVLIVAKDAAENETYLEVFVEVVIPETVLASKGSPVPGAGVVGTGIPAGAVWKTFGVPTINDASWAAVLATYKVGTMNTTAIVVWHLTDAAGTMHVLVKKGDPVASVAGAFYASFKDPLLAPDGAVAFSAKLSGAVLPVDNEAICFDEDGSGPVPAYVVARKGEAISEGLYERKSLGSFAVGGHALAFTSNLVVGVGGVTTTTDTGLWVYNRATFARTLALREGDALLGSTVKTIHSLVAHPGSAGQGRGVESDGSQDYTVVRVTLADARQAVGFIGEDGAGSFSYVSGGDAAGYGEGAVWQKFGLPTQNSVSRAMAFLGTVKAKTGTATTLNNGAIFAEDDEDYLAARIVAKGDAAPGCAGIFESFKDPVSASNRSVAFIGAMKTGPGSTTAANNDGIWWNSPDGVVLVAREGAQPPDAPEGAQWKAFTSLALPEIRPVFEGLPIPKGGPLFVGSMHSKVGTVSPGPGGVTTTNDVGLWATDRFGVLRLLVREGDVIGTSTVKSFTVLSSVVGSPAQTRSFNRNGSVVVRVTDAAGAQHLLHIAVP